MSTDSRIPTLLYSQLISLAVLALLVLTNIASATWSTNPAANTLVTTDANGPAPRIVLAEDIDGGVITVFMDNGLLKARRYDKLGNSMWGPSTVLSYTNVLSFAAVSDGIGGVQIAAMLQTANSRPVYAQHVSASGMTAWPSNGGLTGTQVSSGTGANFNSGIVLDPSIASDGSGGSVIAWAGYSAPYAITTKKILACHVNASGVALGTVLVCAAGGNHHQGNCQIVAAPMPTIGSYILVWEDSRNGLRDIYAQKLNSSLLNSWISTGVPVCTASDDQRNPQVAFRYNNSWDPGAYVVWEDNRSGAGTDIYGQYLDLTTGNSTWALNGNPICAMPGDQRVFSIAMATEPGRDLFVAWQDQRSAGWQRYAQRVDYQGNMAWGTGALVSSAQGNAGILDPQPVTIVAADEGAVITWATYNNSSSTSAMDLYAQRMNPDGTRAWTATGMPLSITPSGNQFLGRSVLLPDASGCNRMIVTIWLDDRGHVNNGIDDAYVQAMRWNDGTLGGGIVSDYPDVWIQRNTLDYGAEPLVYGTDIPYNSPDVWNTVSTGTIDHSTSLTHENPNNAPGHTNQLRVRLRNRGCGSEEGRLTVYLSDLNAAAPWTFTTSGNTFPTDPGQTVGGWTRYPTGASPIGILIIPPIAPGTEYIQNIPWTPPAAGHYCFYVRYESPNDPIHSEGPWQIGNVAANNNIAHRNVDIITQLSPHSVFWCHNLDSLVRSIDVHFTLDRSPQSASTLSLLGIKLKLPQPLFVGWVKAGSKGTGIRVSSDSSILLVGDTSASLAEIPFGKSEAWQINAQFDSLTQIGNEDLKVRVTQYTNRGDSTLARPDGGLTWEVHSAVVPMVAHGGDTIANERPTNRPMHVQTYAIYVSNGNPGRAAIDRVIVGVQGKATILAVGPLRDSQHTTISLARDRTGRAFIYQCDPDDQVRLYAGEAFRPIYLTVATEDTGLATINFQTIDPQGDTITDGQVVMTDRLASGSLDVHEHDVFFSQSLLSSYPNPATSLTSVQFAFPGLIRGADLAIIDATGREVRTLFAGESFEAGQHQVSFDASTLPSGAYFLRLRADGLQYMSSMRVIR